MTAAVGCRYEAAAPDSAMRDDSPRVDDWKRRKPLNTESGPILAAGGKTSRMRDNF